MTKLYKTALLMSSITIAVITAPAVSAQKKTAGTSGSRLRASIGVQGRFNEGDSNVYIYPNNATDSVSETYSYYIPSGRLIPRAKSILLRDAQGRNYLTYDFVRDTATGLYDTTGRLSKTYDASGDPIVLLKRTGTEQQAFGRCIPERPTASAPAIR